MKKYLLGIFAIVLAIGFSAFTVHSSKTTMQDEVTYRWHQYNAAGTAELSPVVEFIGTESEAREALNCPQGISKICASAYDMNGQPLGLYIKKP